MELFDVIKKRRTRRKFLEKKVPISLLESLVEYARFAPMGGNIQPLKYIIINSEEMVKSVFPHTKWSGYHPEDAPTTDEQPTAYIAIIGDSEVIDKENFGIDAGAAGTIILLAAEDMGLASCWLGAINKKKISELLELDEKFQLLYLIAFGYSEQNATYIDSKNGDIKYFLDENATLTVPKRTLDEILIAIK